MFTFAFAGLVVGNGAGAWVARRRALDDAVPGQRPDHTLTWFFAVGGGVALLGLLLLLIVTERHQRQMARANRSLAENGVRGRAVQEVAGRLARALSSDDVVAALLDHLPAAVGGKSAAVVVVAGDGSLQLVGLGSDTVDRGLPAPPGSIVDRVLATREPAWLASPLGWRGDEPAAVLAAEGWALAVLPLVVDDVIGLLAVSYARVHTFVEEERSLLETIGVLAAQALARGRRYDDEHGAALAFQRSALPTHLPDVPGLTVTARYRPGSERASVGGDWYDVLVLDEDHVALLVGDVVGHGMDAAAAMGRLRTGFQMVAPMCPGPGEMVQAIGRRVEAIPNAMCSTVLCVVLDLPTGAIEWCRAGHLPPLLVRDGKAELLDAPGLPPLGVGIDLPAAVHRERLESGDLLLLYTDGVIERRCESIDQGFERLRVVGTDLADLGTEDFADALLEALVPVDEQADDVALLVVRYDHRDT